jgi:hypothetical protein
MTPRLPGTRPAAVAAAVVALLALPLSAPRAQDSFARVPDRETGRPVLSVLGTGIGMPFASLALEMRCPAAEAWTIDVTGVRAPSGTAVAVGFGDPGGGWTPVRVAPLRYEDRSLRVILDRASFREALTQARADYPGAREAEIRIVIGEAVGLTVNRDQMVREMTDFARECDQPRRGAPVRRVAYER